MIKQLTQFDFPDTISVPDGYDQKNVPDFTRRNFQVLIDKVNELVEKANQEKRVVYITDPGEPY